VFYLGFGCLHCVEQLHLLRPLQQQFAELGIDVVAIGSDTAANIQQANLDLPEAERMMFPMLADPKLQAFKAWRCHDDFENMPLHGTFLVDSRGKVRWQDISYEPFTKLDWLLQESARLLALPVPEVSR
jgi:peroxiredoxin